MTETISISEFKKLVPGKGESGLQKACIKWFRAQYPDKVLYSVPNGGKRDEVTAAILKAEGVMAGVPDLFLMETKQQIASVEFSYDKPKVRVDVYHGMYIEMKFGKNGLTAEQISFFAKAQKRGYKCVVCKTVEEFMNEIEKYLK